MIQYTILSEEIDQVKKLIKYLSKPCLELKVLAFAFVTLPLKTASRSFHCIVKSHDNPLK